MSLPDQCPKCLRTFTHARGCPVQDGRPRVVRWTDLMLLLEQWEQGLGQPNPSEQTQVMHHCAAGLRRVMGIDTPAADGRKEGAP
jgi:hypothetical protein